MARFALVNIQVGVVLNIIAATETQMLTTGPINPPFDNAPVLLWWYLTGLVGTAGTNMVTRIRRGPNLTSPLVNIASPGINVTAAGQYQIAGCYVDTPPPSAELVYQITLTQTAATGNGSAIDGCLLAACL